MINSIQGRGVVRRTVGVYYDENRPDARSGISRPRPTLCREVETASALVVWSRSLLSGPQISPSSQPLSRALVIGVNWRFIVSRIVILLALLGAPYSQDSL